VNKKKRKRNDKKDVESNENIISEPAPEARPIKKAKKNKEIDDKRKQEELEDDIFKHVWGEKGDQFKKGKFTLKEERILHNAMNAYIQKYNLGSGGIKILCEDHHVKGVKGAWLEIACCITNRTIESIYDFCRRRFNSGNYQEWTEDDVEILKSLVSKHGTSWTNIGREMGRHPHNCRDKYREVKKKFNIGPWSDDEVKKLLELIKETSGDDSSTHYWTVVSERLGTRSYSQCRKKWKEGTDPTIVSSWNWTWEDEKKLVEAIYESGAEHESEINWHNIADQCEPWKPFQCNRRWHTLEKHVVDYNIKPLTEKLDALREGILKSKTL